LIDTHNVEILLIREWTENFVKIAGIALPRRGDAY